ADRGGRGAGRGGGGGGRAGGGEAPPTKAATAAMTASIRNLIQPHPHSLDRWRRYPRHAAPARNRPPGPASAKRPQAEQATYAARPTRPPPTAYPARPGRGPTQRRLA